MSGSKQCITVSRHYQADPNSCMRALQLLLEKSVSKKAGERRAGDEEKGPGHGLPATKSLPQRP
jgi:hypothetical protein